VSQPTTLPHAPFKDDIRSQIVYTLEYFGQVILSEKEAMIWKETVVFHLNIFSWQ
jgi:hypothetical protein